MRAERHERLLQVGLARALVDFVAGFAGGCGGGRRGHGAGVRGGARAGGWVVGGGVGRAGACGAVAAALLPEPAEPHDFSARELKPAF